MSSIKAVGSKAEVFHGTAKHTSGGLHQKDLMKTKKGRIVSRKKHAAGKKAIQRLFKAGYKPKKGTFSLMKKGATRRSTRRRRGGGGLMDMMGMGDEKAVSGGSTVANVLGSMKM
jgi:hypothetical protein